MTRSLHSSLHRRLREQLVEARTRAGLTQVALGRRLKRPQSYVSKYETGERRLDVVEFVEVVRALRLDPTRVLAELLKVRPPRTRRKKSP